MPGDDLRNWFDVFDGIVVYRQALTFTPKQLDLLNNMGNALEELGRIDAAVAVYEQARTLVPRNPTVLNNLGFALQKRGDLEQAMGMFDEAIKADPDFSQAHRNRSVSCLRAGMFSLGWAAYTWRRPQRHAMPGYPGVRFEVELPFEREKSLIGAAPLHQLEPLDQRLGDSAPGDGSRVPDELLREVGGHAFDGHTLMMTTVWSLIKIA